MRRFIGFILGKLGLGLAAAHWSSMSASSLIHSFCPKVSPSSSMYLILPLLNFSRDAVCVYCRISDWSRDSLQVYCDMMLPKDTLDCHFFGQFFLLNFLMRKAEWIFSLFYLYQKIRVSVVSISNSSWYVNYKTGNSFDPSLIISSRRHSSGSGTQYKSLRHHEERFQRSPRQMQAN